MEAVEGIVKNRSERTDNPIREDKRECRAENRRFKMKHKTVCIVGLGYVGLPLANAFSKHLKVIGYDIEGEKVKRLNESNNKANIEFTTDPSKIKDADFVIIAVPTPVTKSNLRSQTCDMSNQPQKQSARI